MTRHVVVVLNWFGRDDTLACVDSLRDGSPEAVVLVVDNGSFDGTLEEVVLTRPGVHTLQTGRNLGFTGGMNAGLGWALGRGAAVVTLLNNDTLVPPGVMARLAAVAETGVAVSPVVTYADDPSRAWFAGGEVDRRTGLPHHGPSVRLAALDEDGLRPTEVLAGACLTASDATWRRVGLLDERFFLLFEDSEWSRRAVASGIPLRVDARSVVRHRVSASFGGHMSYLGLFYYVRNGLLFLRTGRAGAPTSVRFLREHVLPQVRSGGSDARGDLLRRAAVVAAALATYALRRFGEAPGPVRAAAARWTRDPRVSRG